jgi:ribosomal protein S18 acetylase RimI-like enzyme
MRSSTTFRPISPEDQPFLARLYASTRWDEVAQTGWDLEEQDRFLRMQFAAQHKFYMEQFSGADFHIVELQDEPIGRLYVDRREDEIRIIDIALLPEHRNKGIGSALLKNILAEAHSAALPVRIHVERNNPALGLYQRLGFREIDDQGVYLLMECSPNYTPKD